MVLHQSPTAGWDPHTQAFLMSTRAQHIQYNIENVYKEPSE